MTTTPQNTLTLENVEPYVPGQAQSASGYIEPGMFQPGPESTVAGQMEGLLAKESPYMQAARTKGLEHANSRGLLNSSLAGEASQKAAIESALPIAQQDASTYSQAGLSKQEFDQDQAMVDIQAAASSQLSAQEAAQKKDLADFQETAATARHTAELAMNEKLKGMGLASDETKAIGSSVTLLGQELVQQIASIQANPNLNTTAKTEIVSQITDTYQSNVNSIAAIYGVQIEWT